MRILFTFCFVFCIAFSFSCKSKMNDELAGLKLDSAKAFFYQAERLKPDEKSQYDDLMKKSQSLFLELMNNSNKSVEARYFYAYTLDRIYSGNEAGINFRTISYKNTKEISSLLEQVIKEQPDFQPEYKLSPYSKISSAWGSLALYYIVFDKPDSAKIAFKEGKKAGASLIQFFL